MADIPNRDELERILARKLGKLQRAQMARLLELMGDPPSYANIPAAFWEEVGRGLTAAIVPFLERVYLEAAERMLGTIPIGVDWALINEAASAWARQMAGGLIKGITETTRLAVGRLIGNFFDMGWNMGDLTNRLGQIFSPVRAEMIARTEVTNAAMQGEVSIVNALRDQGVNMIAVWQTRNDELVCPICGPRHGKKKGDGWYDERAAHPRCRCWVNHEFEKPKDTINA